MCAFFQLHSSRWKDIAEKALLMQTYLATVKDSSRLINVNNEAVKKLVLKLEKAIKDGHKDVILAFTEVCRCIFAALIFYCLFVGKPMFV